MEYGNFQLLKVRCEGPVATVTFDNPPINLLDLALMLELVALAEQLAADESLKAVIFQSEHPDFFLAHADVEMILSLPTDDNSQQNQLNFFNQMLEDIRLLPMVTIGKLNGIARGGGSEFLLALDMRFASYNATIGQPEVALGIVPGGGGMSRLPPLLGRGRALEIILGCDDFDGALAERYGYVNRAMEAIQLDSFVDQLASRISSFSSEALKIAKQVVDDSEGLTVAEALLLEQKGFNQTLSSPQARQTMERFLEQGGQTLSLETKLQQWINS